MWAEKIGESDLKRSNMYKQGVQKYMFFLQIHCCNLWWVLWPFCLSITCLTVYKYLVYKISLMFLQIPKQLSLKIHDDNYIWWQYEICMFTELLFIVYCLICSSVDCLHYYNIHSVYWWLMLDQSRNSSFQCYQYAISLWY